MTTRDSNQVRGRGGQRRTAAALGIAALLLALCVGSGSTRDVPATLKVMGPEDFAGVGDSTQRIAPVKFWAPIPDLFSISAFSGFIMWIAYTHDWGMVAALLYGAVMYTVLFFTYFLVSAGTSSDALVATYGLINWQAMFANRGAVGGFYAALGLMLDLLLGGLVGELVARAFLDPAAGGGWKQPYKAIHLQSFCGVNAITWCCAPAKRVDYYAAAPPEGEAAGKGGGKDEHEEHDPTLKDPEMWLALGAGDVVTWRVLYDNFLVGAMILVATWILRDTWTVPRYSWIGFATLILVIAFVAIFFRAYRCGESIDFPHVDYAEFASAYKRKHPVTTNKASDEKIEQAWRANGARVYKRFYTTLQMLYPIFTHIVLYYLAQDIFMSVMDAHDEYRRVIFTHDAAEMRWLGNQNLVRELITKVAAYGVLLVVAVTTLVLVLRSPVEGVGTGKAT